MGFAIFLAIFASFLWASTNHIDKFLLNGIDESWSNIKTLLVFSTLVAWIVLLPIWLIISKFNVKINNISLIAVLSASITYILATYFYFKALEKNETSIVVVMFQLIPVFSYILALIFFKENLTAQQIIWSIVIILSAVLISIDFEEKNSNKKRIALLLVAISSLLYATFFFLFDIWIRNSSYKSCAFWFQIGLLIQGIIFICIKSFRTTFLKAIKNNGKKYFSLNITNEAINLVANLSVNFANVTIPLALANVLNGFQGAFVFIIWTLGVKFLPKYFKENMNKKVVIQKVSCIVLSIIGLTIMFI